MIQCIIMYNFHYKGDIMKNKSFTIDKSIYLDFNKPLSYNALLTFIITERGLGKSYGAKKFVAKRFINKGKQFVYLRRYKTELKQAMMKNGNPLFFKQIENDEELKGHTFSNKNDTMYIDDKLCGFAMPLSIANILKSSTYDNVDTIIFDEFLIDKGIAKPQSLSSIYIVSFLFENLCPFNSSSFSICLKNIGLPFFIIACFNSVLYLLK